MIDANYKYIAIDVDSFDRKGDNGIFFNSIWEQHVLNGSFNFPKERALPETDKVVPFVILGDQAFKLHKNILSPFSQKSVRVNSQIVIFNCRLSRTKRVTENAFGLLNQVFKVYYQPINISSKTCDNLIIVICCLHHILQKAYLENNDQVYYDFHFKNLTRNANMKIFFFFWKWIYKCRMN